MNGAMTAQRLRLILLISMLLLIAAMAGGFWFVQQGLKGYATTISSLNADAQSGDQNIQTLRSLETKLAEEQTTIATARSIVADNATYADQVINDITRIANESGVNITSFEFIDSSTTTLTAPSSPATTAPAAGGAQPMATTATPSGVTKKSVTVALESPLKYSTLMSFIQKIEANELKMQIPSVTMTKEKDDNVTTQTFSIEVYVRQ
ncbi:MAG: hypothetical protein V4678_03560 [Patescibacteria group bacterium]